VDHVRHAVAADRADGEIDIAQPEPVDGDPLQRKSLTNINGSNRRRTGHCWRSLANGAD
jgi:hypothetical protein